MNKHFLLIGTLILISNSILLSCSSPGQSSSPSMTSTPEIINTVTPTVWKIPTGLGNNFRAIHMGGNWGTNQDGGVEELPPDYFEWLRDINIDWVGISVAIYVDDSMDSTVERKYSTTEVDFPTFDDDVLVKMIRAYRQHGFNVFLTLAFEDTRSSTATHPLERWQLGDPDIYEEADILPDFWPWALDHPDHARFISEFWQTYTDQAVHFAKIAEQEGVGLYSLGTETDRIFRTRPSGVGPDDFGNEIRAMVQAVRENYSGLITYDQHYDALIHSDWYPSLYLWEDAGFDVIGISAYFPLVDAAPDSVLSGEDLESRWESIFAQYLIPLKTSYPGKTILFTEFGYTDSLVSPYEPFAEEFVLRTKNDTNGNDVDDGQETQANIYAALFNVMDRHPEVLSGAFLWGNMMASNEMWGAFFGQARGFDIRGKPAEDVVKEHYAEWR